MVAAVRGAAPATIARAYLGAQACAGALWWIAVATSDDVRRWTLGGLSAGLIAVPDLVLFVGASAAAAVVGSRRWAVVAAAWTTVVAVALGAFGLVTREAGAGVVLMAVAAAATLAAAATIWWGRLPLQWFFVGPFRFRPAPNRSRRHHLGQSLVQLGLFWSGFLVLLPLLLAWAERRLALDWPPLAEAALKRPGAAVFLAGSVVGVWACLSMAVQGNGTPLPSAAARQLVVAGPYRWVRNPMAAAGAVQTIGVGLWLGSWMVLASAVAGGLVWHAVIRPEEEADLATRFGSDYEAYRTSVRCWIPGPAHPPDLGRTRPERPPEQTGGVRSVTPASGRATRSRRRACRCPRPRS